MNRTLAAAAAALAALAGALTAGAVQAATTQEPLKDVHWSFEGPLGFYDQAQLQRGFKVYKEVCSSCHSMNMVAWRNLGDPGGPFWNPKYKNPNDNPVVKALAKDVQYGDIDSETGETIKRPGTSADYLPNPFPNPEAARAANGGALPPDMSLLEAAREGGPKYIYSVVTGDGTAAPNGLTIPTGKYYDPWMPGDLSGNWTGPTNAVPIGGFIAMPPPLTDNRVHFDDGVSATKNQEAKDVAAFLTWASDPKMEERKVLGIEVMIFLVIFTGLLYASYRAIWRKVAH
ncbi:MAG TPA: cytochrome c1 [Caulobacteraceae bacterium]|jgi:ubiquinol-cytochrome c reductase cytochrome c1 subunit|nr:cytochrome c1 [Caulobacteraceae bacterium]